MSLSSITGSTIKLQTLVIDDNMHPDKHSALVIFQKNGTTSTTCNSYIGVINTQTVTPDPSGVIYFKNQILFPNGGLTNFTILQNNYDISGSASFASIPDTYATTAPNNNQTSRGYQLYPLSINQGAGTQGLYYLELSGLVLDISSTDATTFTCNINCRYNKNSGQTNTYAFTQTYTIGTHFETRIGGYLYFPQPITTSVLITLAVTVTSITGTFTSTTLQSLYGSILKVY